MEVAERHEVRQPVDNPDGPRLRFMKEVLHLRGPATLAMVRKRLPQDVTPITRGAVLLTHGFGQNRHTWHLPGRSFANHLAAQGWDVYNLDLRGHGRSRALGGAACQAIDEYIHHDLPAALDAARAHAGVARMFLVGHSLGGLIGYAAAPTRAHTVAGVVTLGAPYAFGRGNRVLLEAARALVLLTGRARRGATVPMRLIQAWFRSHRALWDHPRLPLPVRAWHPESLEPALLDEYLRLAFDHATLGELATTVASGTAGRFTSLDGTLDYAATWESADLPTLILAGTRDLLAPVDSVSPAYTRSASRDRTFHTVPLGHADIILGREAPRLVWPLVDAWLARRAARGRIVSGGGRCSHGGADIGRRLPSGALPDRRGRVSQHAWPARSSLQGSARSGRR